jgi:hypothetical protein
VHSWFDSLNSLSLGAAFTAASSRARSTKKDIAFQQKRYFTGATDYFCQLSITSENDVKAQVNWAFTRIAITTSFCALRRQNAQ